MHVLDRKACVSVIVTEPNFIKILFALDYVHEVFILMMNILVSCFISLCYANI